MPSDERGPSRQDQAAAWFAAERAGVMLVEQREAFDAWRADPRNQAALDAMRDLWNDLAVLKGPAGPAAAPVRRKRGLSRAMAAAAALAVISGGGISMWLAMKTEMAIHTVVGEQKTQSLPDGSIISVNVASDVTYDVTTDARLIKLVDGEAAFSVKADTSRPFVVRAGDFEIRAVGTSFNVRQRGGEIAVAVSEGAVEIRRAGGAQPVLASLGAGQALTFPMRLAEGRFQATPAPVASAQISEWRMRIVTYEDAPLHEVVDDLNRYFDDKLLVEPDLRHRRVTVRLKVDDRDRAIETLAGLLGARVVSTTKGLELQS